MIACALVCGGASAASAQSSEPPERGADSDSSDSDGADSDGADSDGADSDSADSDSADSEGADSDGADSDGADSDGAGSDGADSDGADAASDGGASDGTASGDSAADGSGTEPERGQGQREPAAVVVPDPAIVVLHVGHGLHVRSPDGAFGLRIGLRGQLRPTLEIPSGADARFDFAVRRARLNFGGHLFDPGNSFKIQLAFSPEDLGITPDGTLTQTPLLDYMVDFRHLRDLEVVIGHYKRPFARERISSSGELSLVDRSIVDDALQLDRDLGFDLRSRDFLGLGWLRYYLGMSTGEGRDGGVGQDFGFLYFARLEILPLGMFDDHTQGDMSRGVFPRLSLGFAYAFADDTRSQLPLDGGANADGGTTDYHQGVFDLLFMWYGLTIEVDVIARFGVRTIGDARDEVGNLITPTLPSNGIGWFAQAGYLLPDVDLEIAARVGINTPFGDATQSSFIGAGELGGGLGYYFEQHALSLHLDYFHLWTSDFDRGDERVRLQLELIL